MADHRNEAGELSRALAAQAEAVCRHYLDAGRRSGGYWTVGDVDNAPGRSLFVRLRGPTSGKGGAGRWCDAATGQHGDLLDLIALNRGYSALRDAMDEARSFLSLPRSLYEPSRRTDRITTAPDTVAAARRLFGAGQPIRDTLAERYFRARGIDLAGVDLGALRFHPAATYREASDALRQTYPALLAAVTDLAGTLTGVHRTYLDPQFDASSDLGRLGKAKVPSPRRSLGRLAGNGVRLRHGDGSALLVGEGIETVLSLTPLLPPQASLPCFASQGPKPASPGVGAMAALSAAHLAMLALPPALATLFIARDNDAAGCGAAERLRERAEAARIAVTVLRPRLIDFNADLRRWGAGALAQRVGAQLLTSG